MAARNGAKSAASRDPLSILQGLPTRDVNAFIRLRNAVGDPLLIRYLAIVQAHNQRVAKGTTGKLNAAAERLRHDVEAALDRYVQTLDGSLPRELRDKPAQVVRIDFTKKRGEQTRRGRP